MENYNYGKRPLWQWILIYLIIAGIAYGAIYVIFFNKGNGYNTNYQTPNSNDQTESAKSEPTNNNKNYMIQNMNVEILQEGTGEAVKSGDKVTVNYTGTLTDGTKFDSSLNPGRTPFEFTIDKSSVIQGWHLGVTGMKVGEKRKLTIPAELGYGAMGRAPVIPPNATLIFEIDLLAIN